MTTQEVLDDLTAAAIRKVSPTFVFESMTPTMLARLEQELCREIALHTWTRFKLVRSEPSPGELLYRAVVIK